MPPAPATTASSPYWVVEGPIGAGKTTLARRLAQSLGGRLLLEQPDDNPFLPRFYRDPVGGALPAQLGFLLQRAGQVEQMQQGDLFSAHWVADFLFDKDRLFAELTLSAPDLRAYDAVFRRLRWQVPQPTAVVYLTGPVERLMQRIKERGRGYERHISPQYLSDLGTAYTRFFAHYRAAPVLHIDIGRVDLQEGAHFDDVQQWLRKPQPGQALGAGLFTA